ncbi:MAG TPA: prepilin-type N-terminal cleavage/methylation domain-containing protein, partial [Candidatus Obscuribacterales bacterium]
MEHKAVSRPSFSCPRQYQGFSLVELMVALVIGLIVVLGAGQLFIASKRTYGQMEELATRQHNLRALYDFISLDVRTATSAMVNGTGSELTLYYEGVRQSDPSCGGGNLVSVKYSYASPSVMVGIQCGS